MRGRRNLFFSIVGLSVLFLLLLGGVTKSHAMTTEEEKKMGRRIVEELERKVEVVQDIPLRAFINRMGRTLAAHADPNPFEMKFYLINGQEPNAMAIPGGYIVVTTGLIVLAENEDEIAGVLSHEIAHVTGRHVVQLIEKTKRLNLASLAAILIGAIAGGGGTTSQAIAATAMATTEALALKYTREMEREADQNGLHILLRAGYDPGGLFSFLNKINKMSLASESKIPAYLSTHPGVEDRIALLENLLQIESKARPSVKPAGGYRRIQGRAFVAEREPSVSVAHFDSMVKTDPGEVSAHLGLGLSYQKMGRLDQSLTILQQALSRWPGDKDLLRELGIASFLSGKLDQAIETLRSVSEEGGSHEDPASLFYLARAYQERGEAGKALPLFLRFRNEMPDFPEINRYLGSVYGRLGQKGLSHLYFGKDFRSRGDRNNALLHFRTALKFLEPGSPERTEAEREIRELTAKGQEKQKN